jgi:hypothetical protein
MLPSVRRSDATKLPDETGVAGQPSGTLFEFQEITRTRNLEALVRQANAMAGCR